MCDHRAEPWIQGGALAFRRGKERRGEERRGEGSAMTIDGTDKIKRGSHKLYINPVSSYKLDAKKALPTFWNMTSMSVSATRAKSLPRPTRPWSTSVRSKLGIKPRPASMKKPSENTVAFLDDKYNAVGINKKLKGFKIVTVPHTKLGKVRHFNVRTNNYLPVPKHKQSERYLAAACIPCPALNATSSSRK